MIENEKLIENNYILSGSRTTNLKTESITLKKYILLKLNDLLTNIFEKI